MGTIAIRQFTGGLDVRRLPETTPGGVLTKANDGHVNRGGEFEQRAAFVTEYALPAGTVGLAYTRGGLVVFGSDAAPAMPAGVQYQRLQHPSALALTQILSWDLYQSKIYVVGQFSDGSIYHFYDGAIVSSWYDGRARASFQVDGGVNTTATAAVGSFEVTGGVTGSLAGLTVGGVVILTGPVAFATSNAVTATNIAAAINSLASTPDYSAVAVGQKVVITAAYTGTTGNGLSVVPVVAGDLTVGSVANMGGAVNTVLSKVANIQINGVAIITAPVAWAGSNEATATAIASRITTDLSTPEYTATATGATVNIVAATAGIGPNGFAVALTPVDGMALSSSLLTMAGGVDTGGAIATGGFSLAIGVGTNTSATTFLPKLNGQNLTTAAISWNANSTQTASDLAAAIAAYSGTSGVTATSAGRSVTLKTVLDTATVNGVAPVVTVVNSQITTPIVNIVPMTGGKADAYTPGAFVRTLRSKMYSTSGGLLHFSGIAAPTKWTTEAAGAGFIDFSAENSGAEDLLAVSRYLNQLAVFSKTVIFVEFVDPDPALNTLSQVLLNTGTIAPRSVTQFGDADVFYLDGSGLRSLRARYASSVAATSDIGTPVDDAITTKVGSMTEPQIGNIIGMINPIDKRFWLIMGDLAYVFTFYENAKVSAWSIYNFAQTASAGATPVGFTVSDAVVFGGRPWLRAGDTVYSYGGRSGDLAYDYTAAEVWLPMLDADDPTTPKAWGGVDIAIRGKWQVRAAMDTNNLATEDVLMNVYETSFNGPRQPMGHTSTHIGLRFISSGGEKCILSSAVIHYEPTADEG